MNSERVKMKPNDRSHDRSCLSRTPARSALVFADQRGLVEPPTMRAKSDPQVNLLAGGTRCGFQAKLQVSQPNEPYEQEADLVADQVFSMPAPVSSCNAETPGCRGPQAPRVQRRATPATVNGGATVPENFLQSLGPGQPLDNQTRSFFEPRFGHDFSRVRVHTDAKAAESAREVNALAYTVGKDIVFGEAQYALGNSKGKSLLAHELVHVLQQRGGASAMQTALAVNTPDDNAEREADVIASHVLTPGDAPSSRDFVRRSEHLQRQEPQTTSVPSLVPVIPEIANLPGNLYVDLFESVYYDLDYRAEGGRLSEYLTVTYADGTVIDIHINNIIDESMASEAGRNAMAQGYVGDGGRIFPQRMNSRTTPRLTEAKRSAIEAMEEYNVQFIMMTVPVVLFVITMPLAVRGGRPTATRQPVVRRPVSAAPPANTLNQTLQAALRPNTLRHIFGKAMHKLDPLLRQLGGEEAVVREAVRGLGNTALPSAGQFQVVVNIAGANVTIRGAVVNGIARISTMFVP